MLARSRERISFALLVGMQTSAPTLENSMEVPQKLKIELLYNPAIALLGIYPRDTGVLFQRDTCTPMFIAALSTIAKVWKEPKCPSMDEWIKKMWCWGAWVAQSVKLPTSARSRSRGPWVRAPRQALGWWLGAWSLFPILCLPLSLPLPPFMLCLSLSQK